VGGLDTFRRFVLSGFIGTRTSLIVVNLARKGAATFGGSFYFREFT